MTKKNVNYQRSRLFPNPLGIDCPWCMERATYGCRNAKGNPLGEDRYHVSRIGMAKKLVGEKQP